MDNKANQNQKGRPFRLFRFLLQSLDPLHVGVGGYRLGRVDLPIAREPGTNIPKLPGTGLNGAIRHYAALRCDKPGCAGAGQGEGDDEKSKRGHCGEKNCPICYTFGSLRSERGEEKGAAAGTVRIFDARLLLFPVHSAAGPVWITSPGTLRDFGLEGGETNGAPGSDKEGVKALVAEGLQDHPVLNLGWLMVKVANSKKNGEAQEKAFKLENCIKKNKNPAGSAQKEGGGGPAKTPGKSENAQGAENTPLKDQNSSLQALIDKIPKDIRSRLVLLPEDVFSHVVNSNLEVRTSVSIDPETGAAKQGALFTYEAIPRAAFFWLDVVENNYRKAFPAVKDKDKIWEAPIDVVTAGIEWLEYLGVGGMATRGFGRIKKMGCLEVM